MKRKRSLYEQIMWLFLVLMVSSFLTFNTSAFSSMSIVLFTGLVFLIYAIQKKGIIRVPLTIFQAMVLTFSAFCLISSLWAANGAASRSKALTILEILICMTIIFWCYFEKAATIDLLKAVMWSGAIIAVYSIYYYGPTQFLGMVTGTHRIGNDYANANAIGMWAAISAVLFFYYILNEGWRWKYSAVILPILLVAMAQSRTALIEVIIGVLLVLFFRYRDGKSFLKSAFRILTALCVAVLVFVFLSRLDIFSGLNRRMQSLLEFYKGSQAEEGSVLQRELYIRAGWEQFLKTPILGIGIGNTNQIARAATGHNTYLHNNFVELLASGGLVGFCLYYGMTVYLFVKLLPHALKKEKPSDACLIILIVHTIADYGTVSYYTKGTYFILMICFLQVYLNKKGRGQHESI